MCLLIQEYMLVTLILRVWEKRPCGKCELMNEQLMGKKM